MYIFRYYDKNKSLDKAWYSSSNVFYSECDDTESNLKTVRVSFKNGATYEYYDVDVNDYVMFLHGGLDGSSGKALNKYIKKYDYRRIEDKDPNILAQELETTKLLAQQEEKSEETVK